MLRQLRRPRSKQNHNQTKEPETKNQKEMPNKNFQTKGTRRLGEGTNPKKKKGSFHSNRVAGPKFTQPKKKRKKR